nr:EscU/YscU/HrcU family type III secretion system export apparatus switch protein [Sedimentibacter sp.]
MSLYNNKRAVALKYDLNKNNAPVVIASGSGYIANKVVEIAEENGVPIYKDDSLSILLSQLDVGSEIPEEMFGAIVEIYLYFLNFKPDVTGGNNI